MSSLKQNDARAPETANVGPARSDSGLKRSLKSTTMLNRLSTLGATLVVSGVLLVASGGDAQAQAVGDPIVNPVTGAVLAVTAVVPNGVLATGNVFILTSTAVGTVLPDPTNPAATVTIASRVINATTHLVESVTFVGGRTLSVLVPVTAPSPGVVGTTPVITLAAGAGDANNLAFISPGRTGDGGHDGALFVSPASGDPGAPGPSVIETVAASRPNITTVTQGLPGIIAVSLGGNGGAGGDGYLGPAGAQGGAGGAGGTVNLTSHVAQISTTGNLAHGIVAQSRSGRGGLGGDGILAVGGGAGGAGNDGGSATATSYGAITTRGNGAIGVFAQSLGGGAGDGGGSYGLFGNAGDGDVGGNGGRAEAINYGTVSTLGNYAYGVSAQSIGGIGGNAGDSVALVAFTSTGAPGGNGGTAIARAQAGSSIRTEGLAAYGLFAQSIGGGGGNGGLSVGLVALGSDGAAGGNGGLVQVFTQAGAAITTTNSFSHAIFAQSVGGGGGNGGLTSGAFAMGGDGSGGGIGGTVFVESGAAIRTEGLDARGIFAQSVGGGGGSAFGTGGIVSLGGGGGAGGASGTVTINALSGSQITTTQRGGDGIFAQSVGGGGGSGSTSGGVVALGGDGGLGGAGNTVLVTNYGSISTAGHFARGIFAQSVGGGGGSGGDSGGLVALGGDGAAASAGGNVTVNNHGAITTALNIASAIQAQSIGGGGGDGGTTGGVFLTIGGDGGGGGDAGLVTVNNYNNLTTEGDDAHGIFAQSVGGGGGNGGASVSVSAFAGVAIGGAGEAGGAGGQVDVNFYNRTVDIAGVPTSVLASIETSGDRSRGIYAQSVGGGGGSGGFASQTSVGFGGAVSIAIGGSGAGGGAGGAVNVFGDVAINTTGRFSEGILAQSVGGGGGAGGFAVAVAFAASPGPAASLSVGIGGSGAGGGAGGLVTLDAGGSIVTEGQFSTGLLAQSVGGGGGNGGFSVSASIAGAPIASLAIGVGIGGSAGAGGLGGVVDATFNGTIRTVEDDSHGAVIQSVGGGGGNGGFNVSGAVGLGGVAGGAVAVGVGGSGGAGGQGGTATGHIGDTVDTTGDRSTGVTIQSVGGGGGSGGFNISGSIGGGGVVGGAVSVGVGGSGDTGGDGGTVDAYASSIITRGEQAGGFLAQSVGGGGGSGAMNVSGNIAASLGAGSLGISVGVGGAGGGGGNGGQVTAQVVGDVSTGGTDSDGIVAQSVGGGGGGGGLNVSAGLSVSAGASGAIGVGVGGNGGLGGNAESATLTVTGTTRTTGLNSDAIIVQSVGGGGGGGGVNVTGNVALSSTAAGTIGVGVGGSGGGGGNSLAAALRLNEGVADATNTLLAASTTGDNASAIVVQSVAGGGGSGAVNVTGALSLSSTVAANIAVGVGGSGGDGGDSGVNPLDVMAYALVNGDIVTTGNASAAVFVQSLGGGGGNGGVNVTAGISGSTSLSGNLLVGVGGFGGLGGNAGAVGGSITSDIWTGTLTSAGATDIVTGHGSSAVTFQSLGGGGGNGALNVTGGLSIGGGPTGTLAVGIGGFAGGGGNGSTVDATFNGSIQTLGDQAHGLLLQSLGGGGGNGGINITGAVSLSGGASGAVGFGLGGFGGDGGYAGAVTGVLTGDVLTHGDNSFGAVLQSLGGGGGNGALNVTGTLAASTGGGSGSLGIGIGGFGGDGGTSASVHATVNGLYTTYGVNSGGVLAQSLAGGGGNGGLNVSAAVQLGTGSGAAGSVGIGGFGGDAASTAGEVILNRTGDTVTQGAGSDGVTAQSLGGGGGNGGINISAGVSATQGSGASLGFGLGGFGGEGGDAGLVTANIQGNVIARGLASDVTYDDVVVTIDLGAFAGGLTETEVLIPGAGRQRLGGSNGVVVQSQGGGGGVGGLNVTGQLAVSSNSGRAVAIGIGGFGGGGGDAGVVDLTLGSLANHVQVQGIGDGRSAVIVQSVGGGGGVGGINVSGGISTNGNLVAGIGGFGGDGGLGRAVTANIDADLFAAGNLSRGLLAQSVGGGGGYGGINVSAGINAAGSINSGNDSSLVFGLGGFGGAGNASGNVNVTHNGQVSVEGQGSVGLLVQSVAGGGGSGGLNVSGNLALGGSDGFAVAIGIGGSGGTGADAGVVTLNSTGNIFARTSTEIEAGASDLDSRRRATSTAGIIAQSIGGGGGQGGVNVTGAIARNGSPIAVGVGGSGGSGGNGNDVTVTRGYVDNGAGVVVDHGLIHTYGNEGVGLLAQSVGGGGGNAGVNLVLAGTLAGDDNPVAANIAVGGSGGGAGYGTAVTVTHHGDIITDGNSSGGLIAQSIGGGGGNANFNVGLGYVKGATALNLAIGGGTGAAGSGGLVTVNHIGDITTGGDDSIGLLAQSVGGGGGNVALSMAMGLGSSRALNIGIGREGGTGGTGGNIIINANANIDTTGARSSGIVGQSVGGGGGTSGSTSVGVSSTSGTGTSARGYQGSVAVGLTGGIGAVAGTVDIDASGSVVTRGDSSHAIHAQSTGGGGGTGGAAMNTLIRQSGSFTVGVGGDGGSGNDGGLVTVVSDATLVTGGDAADGIFAQSIGGGGGTGGYSALLAVQIGGAASNGSSNLAVNVGGSGANGSSGEAVNVINRGIISTTGERSFGIRAQSIGGGGGDGGMAIGFRAQGSGDNMSAEFRVGGAGNGGGAGRNVDVLNEGLIVTTGRESAGISANSIGGGGGNGGLVVDAVGGAAGAGNTTGRFIVNIGGSGGTGGTSGDVTVTNRATAVADSGTILTTGEGAYGILAQSLSGGGGNGSSVISLTAMSSGSDSGTFGLNIGGSGGAANQAGTVTVNNGGIIETTGAGAYGILAQSIGGGGGNGGLSLAGSLLIGSVTSTPLISIGGAGGDGGDANTVTVNNTGNILTRGALAHGIVAQSIGGGGGNANMGISASGNIYTAVASNALAAIVGAVNSGNGGLGGAVIVNHSGDITVLGEGSQAIKAESINGGGGSLTFDFEGITSAPGRPFAPPGGGTAVDPLVQASLGGRDVSDMNAGSVSGDSTGTFGSAGNNGAGAVAQSIGGGGGTADVRVSLGVEAPVPAPLFSPTAVPAPGPAYVPVAVPVNFAFTLGGVNGVNNSGALVTTSHSGTILTTGTNAPGVLMQSIGGGGGRSNVNIIAPSGSLLGTVSLQLGGTNGTNETGGAVHRAQTGQVVTTGNLSPAVQLQSIGGGGGSSSLALTGDGSLAGVTAATLGAAGGTLLDGGAVSGIFSGGIATLGNNAVGLLAQSIGAGGGDVRTSGGAAVEAYLGASAGASGTGGSVNLANDGAIQTEGSRSHGVLLQSIGGGGGAVLTATPVQNIVLSSQNTGDGGTVTFNQTGSIVALGTDSVGLIAQSLGGGGGWVDGAFAGTAGGAGRGGAINLSISGDIFAAESGSTALLAQSLGRDGAGNITTFVTGGVRGGSGSGMGVMFDGGLNNRLVTSGSLSAVSGLAINATFGNDTVSNTGLVVGNVDLGSGSNAFNNETGSTFVAFNTIDLRDTVAPPAPLAPVTKGAAAQVIPSMAVAVDGPEVLPVETGSAKGSDQPQVIPGLDTNTKAGDQPQVLPALAAGPGPLAAPLPVTAATFANAGNFVMGLSASRNPIDLANGDVFGNLDDDGTPQTNLLYGARVNNSVNLDGHFLQTAGGNLVFDVGFGPYGGDVVNVSGDTIVDGTGQVILTWLENSNPYTLFATQGTAVDNGLEIDDTLAIDFGIIANSLGIQLTVATDFGLPFLNANEQALGGHMDSAITVGGSGGIGRLMALIGNLQAGQEATYAGIFDQLNPEPHMAPTYRQLVAAEDFSQQLFSCPGRVSRLEDQCVWARVETASTDRTGNVENYGVEGQTMQFRGGFEHRLDARWSLAGAVGYDRLDRMHVDAARAHTEGDGVHGGLGVRHAGPGGDEVGVSLSGGWQWLETERRVDVFQPGVGTSSPETGYAQLEVHAARVFTRDALFLRPALTATYTALHHAGLTETGLDGLGVQVLEETQYIGSITPELGVGVTMQDDERGYASATFTVGQVFRSDDQLVLPMRLIGANPAADPALIATALDRQALRLEAELRVARANGLELRVGYTAELSDDVHNHTAGVSLKMPF